MTDKHIAYMHNRYLYTDDNGDNVYTDEYPVYCGSTDSRGSTVMCDKCEKQAEADYPQGWSYYPGDVCVHGMYTGGCGIDHICQYCEDGLTYWHDNPEYRLMVSVIGGAPHDSIIADSWYTARDGDIKYGCEQVSGFMEHIVNTFDHDEDWYLHGVPTFTFHAVKVSGGYWSDGAQETP